MQVEDGPLVAGQVLDLAVELGQQGQPTGFERLVGRIVAGASADGEEVVELSVAMALRAVQPSLRQQGKPPLQVSEKTLISQLEAEGLLLDRDNRPIVPGRGGNHTRQVRIERRRVRVIRMKLAHLLGTEEEAPDEEPGSEDS